MNMVLIETLTESQRDLLVKVRRELVIYLGKRGPNAQISARILNIDKELAPKNKSIQQREW